MDGRIRTAQAGRLHATHAGGAERPQRVRPDLLEVDVHVQDGAQWTALHFAVQIGNVECTRDLLAARADPNKAPRNGCTTLMLACQNGHHGCARALLEGGAAVDQTEQFGWTALMFAAQGGHISCVRALLEAGAPGTRARRRYGPLDHGAQWHGTPLSLHDQVAYSLLEAGASVLPTQGLPDLRSPSWPVLAPDPALALRRPTCSVRGGRRACGPCPSGYSPWWNALRPGRGGVEGAGLASFDATLRERPPPLLNYRQD